MPSCFAPGCNHDSRRERCSFFRFPKSAVLRRKWIGRCRRSDIDFHVESRLCSCHFQHGKKENGPSVFRHNKEKSFTNWNSLEKWNQFVAEQFNQESLPASVEIPESSSSTDSASQSSESSNGCLPSPSLEAGLYFLKQDATRVKEKLKETSGTMTFQEISKNSELVYHYTGLPSAEEFYILLELLKRKPLNYYKGWNAVNVSLESQLLITLMKLRLNLTNMDLCFRFKVGSKSTITNIFLTLVYALYQYLFEGFMCQIPSRLKISLSLPKSFDQYRNCRIVLDCMEVEVSVSNDVVEQCAMFSQYKQRTTLKAVIGVAPNEVITYVSDLYPGSMSDTHIVEHCGILSQLDPGDLILADKGFLMELLPEGVSLNILPFVKNGQLTTEEEITTHNISEARIHVERAIGRIRNFRILDFIPAKMKIHAAIILKTCSALVNMQNTLLSEK